MTEKLFLLIHTEPVWDELEQLVKPSLPPCTKSLVLLWLFLHPWTGRSCSFNLVFEKKKDFLNRIPAFYQLHVDTEALQTWPWWKQEEARTGIIHIKYVEMSTLGQKVGKTWFWQISLQDRFSTPSVLSRCPRLCTVLHRCYWWESQAEPAPDPSERVWTVAPQISPAGLRLKQSAAAVKAVPHVSEGKP